MANYRYNYIRRKIEEKIVTKQSEIRKLEIAFWLAKGELSELKWMHDNWDVLSLPTPNPNIKLPNNLPDAPCEREESGGMKCRDCGARMTIMDKKKDAPQSYVCPTCDRIDDI